MKLLSKQDVVYALVTGLTAGILAWRILSYLGKSLPLALPLSALIAIVPLCWLAGVQLGYFLGRWMLFFDQFGKFAAIGFTNFAVDSGVLNLLIAQTGIVAGTGYATFKVISFIVAVTHSYYWNKTWTFQARGSFSKFMLVMIASLVVNVAVASIVVNLIPQGNTSPEVWANIAAVVGSAVALIFSFIGFKVVVFWNPKT